MFYGRARGLDERGREEKRREEKRREEKRREERGKGWGRWGVAPTLLELEEILLLPTEVLDVSYAMLCYATDCRVVSCRVATSMLCTVLFVLSCPVACYHVVLCYVGF